MRIGSSIGLIAIGLILALAVNVRVPGLDVHLIGWIVAIVGIVGLIVSLVMSRRARPVVATEEYARPVVRREEYPPPPVVRREEYPPAAPRDY